MLSRVTIIILSSIGKSHADQQNVPGSGVKFDVVEDKNTKGPTATKLSTKRFNFLAVTSNLGDIWSSCSGGRGVSIIPYIVQDYCMKQLVLNFSHMPRRIKNN